MWRLGSHWSDCNKIRCWIFFENLSRKLNFHYIRTRITPTLPEDVCTFKIISGSVLLRTRNVSKNSVWEIKTHIICSITFPENFGVYEIIRKNVVQTDRQQMTIIRRMRFASWIIEVPNKHIHSEYVIYIYIYMYITFPLQQTLSECVSVWRYAYIDRLVTNTVATDCYV